MGAGLRLGVCWLSGPGKVKRSELHVIYMFNESQSCSTWFKVRIRDKQTIINSINRRFLSLSLTVLPFCLSCSLRCGVSPHVMTREG